MKHTPGPWEFINEGEDVTGHTEYIATLAYSTCDEKIKMENARLIAAAPDLLAIAEGIVMYPDVKKHIAAKFPGLIKQAEAAIAKVKEAA